MVGAPAGPLLREAIARHGGVVGTQGDGFFVVCPTAPGALEAVQEAFAQGPIGVRMSLHTGTPGVIEQGYVGRGRPPGGPQRCLRPRGGQVLISASTAFLLCSDGTRDGGEAVF